MSLHSNMSYDSHRAYVVQAMLKKYNEEKNSFESISQASDIKSQKSCDSDKISIEKEFLIESLDSKMIFQNQSPLSQFDQNQ